MLLTLTARSLQSRLAARGRNRLEIKEVPAYAIDRLALRGLVVDTDLLRGWALDQLDSLRNAADQAGCPCLVLRESQPIVVRGVGDQTVAEGLPRLDLIARAGHRLGCNAVAIHPVGVEAEADVEPAADFLRGVMDRVDRMEMNLLVEGGDGYLHAPQAIVALIKKVGGFRIGAVPSFAAAIEHGDPVGFLRQTAPYASAVLATCSAGSREALTARNRKVIRECVLALKKVGYEQILAIDFVGEGDPDATIDAARDEINAALEEE